MGVGWGRIWVLKNLSNQCPAGTSQGPKASRGPTFPSPSAQKSGLLGPISELRSSQAVGIRLPPPNPTPATCFHLARLNRLPRAARSSPGRKRRGKEGLNCRHLWDAGGTARSLLGQCPFFLPGALNFCSIECPHIWWTWPGQVEPRDPQTVSSGPAGAVWVLPQLPGGPTWAPCVP